MCRKCNTQKAEVLAQQRAPLCRDCLCKHVEGRARSAVRLKKLIDPGDKVLFALSGGHSSAAMLHVLQAMRSSTRERAERGLLTFDVLAVYICEGSVHGIPDDTCTAVTQQIAQSTHQAGVEFASARLEQIFDGDAESGSLANGHQSRAEASADVPVSAQQKLQSLVQAVTDATGRESLASSLRDRLLRLLAQKHGCNRIAVGDNATRLAVKTISLAIQGTGFALPASLHHLDSRRVLKISLP
ncbi:hypothetical protein WJX73_006786 [Symbiochloris irregularis]|uniref:Cytoplasmic tRNA 2-thiolation protein 2 n=1 Tax=Symbiochloris irregularis TaxID=706552 RepID=A0AAW1PMS0_9CHLO